MGRRDSGFTLVELMVAVLIIGILVTVAMPVYSRAAGNAALKSCQANQRTLSGMAALQRATDGGASLSGGVLQSGGSGWYDVLVPALLRSAPLCPLDEASYLMDPAGTVLGDRGAVQGFKLGHEAR